MRRATTLVAAPIDEKEALPALALGTLAPQALLAAAALPRDFDCQRVESRSADCHNSDKIDLLAASQHHNLDIAP
jgi:hypothetical protein